MDDFVCGVDQCSSIPPERQPTRLSSVLMPRTNAAPDGADLTYFAFVNYTTLGYGDILPVPRWRLLGPMTAMNGVLLFGWSTAVIFEVLRRTIAEHGSFASST